MVECYRSPELKPRTLEDIRAWPSTRLGKTQSSMMLESCVRSSLKQNGAACGTFLCLVLAVCIHVCVCACVRAVPPSIRGTDRDVPDDVTVVVNKSTLLECHVDGSPTPKISWLKDGLLLNPDSTHTLLSSGRTLQVSCPKRRIWKHQLYAINVFCITLCKTFNFPFYIIKLKISESTTPGVFCRK